MMEKEVPLGPEGDGNNKIDAPLETAVPEEHGIADSTLPAAGMSQTTCGVEEAPTGATLEVGESRVPAFCGAMGPVQVETRREEVRTAQSADASQIPLVQLPENMQDAQPQCLGDPTLTLVNEFIRHENYEETRKQKQKRFWRNFMRAMSCGCW